jgi:predicted nucleic acid-binding protein
MEKRRPFNSELDPSAVLLMGGMKGRKEAARRGIPGTGTLGILHAASRRGYLRLAEVLSRLQNTNFYIRLGLVESLLSEEEGRAPIE